VIEFDGSVCKNMDEATSREWLETNGIGGFASGTVSGIHTRRYHGLLVAATKPPVGRMLMVSKLEETLIVDGNRFDLSANEYPGAIHPRGFEYLAGFRLDPWPIYTYEVAGVRLEKSVFMAYDRNTTVVTYNVLAAPADVELRLELRPLLAGRDYHSTTHENGAISRCYEMFPNAISLVPYEGLPRTYFAHNAASVEEQNAWYKNFIYPIEQERGLIHVAQHVHEQEALVMRRLDRRWGNDRLHVGQLRSHVGERLEDPVVVRRCARGRAQVLFSIGEPALLEADEAHSAQGTGMSLGEPKHHIPLVERALELAAVHGDARQQVVPVGEMRMSLESAHRDAQREVELSLPAQRFAERHEDEARRVAGQLVAQSAHIVNHRRGPP